MSTANGCASLSNSHQPEAEHITSHNPPTKRDACFYRWCKTLSRRWPNFQTSFEETAST